MTLDRIDCVLVGSFDTCFDSLYRSVVPSGRQSAFLSYLQHNSVEVQGRRLTYSELLNLALSRATGVDPQFHVGRLPNLASHYLASFLGRRGFSTSVVNCLPYDDAQLRAALAQRPMAIALSTTLYLDPGPVQQTVQRIRALDPRVRIIVGGPFIFNTCRGNDSLTQNILFDQMGADVYVDESQGEATLARVLGRLQAGRDLEGVANVIWRSPGGRWQHEPREAEANDLDDESIDWSVFSADQLGPTVQTRTARSCAFKCSFCSHPQMAGALSLASVDVVERELSQMAAHGVRNVVFIDDTFNVPLPRFKNICRMMIRRKFPLRVFSYLRAGNADMETFDLMAQAGWGGVFLGVESGDQEILGNMNKFAKVGTVARGVRALRERGITTFASFIVGFPGETEASIANTIAFIEDNAPTFYRAEVWYADPGTPVMRDPERFGIRGAAFSWRHATMDWRQATQWVHEIYSTVTASQVLPVYGFDFWSLPYLLGQGLTLDDIQEFARAAGSMMLRGMTPGAAENAGELERLVAVSRNFGRPPPTSPLLAAGCAS